ncbi:hypothetical protein ES708_10249 [subsurface metagenome]
MVGLPAQAGAHEHGYLGDNARSPYLGFEQVAVHFQRVHAFLKAGAAGVVEADQRPAHLLGEINSPDFLNAVVFTEGSGHGHEVFGEGDHRPSVDQAVARYYTFRRYLRLVHAEIGGAVLDEQPYLVEGAPVEEIVDSLAGRPLASIVSLFYGFRGSHLFYFGSLFLIFFD